VRRTIRLGYSDFWSGFDPADNWWSRTLSRRFDVEISDRPELLLFSCFGNEWRRYDCTRLYIGWENRGWGFSRCDWAFTSDLVDDPRHRRVPLWVTWLDHPFIQPVVDLEAAARRKFASVVVSNGASPTRNRIHELLDERRPVASGGRFRNNVGGPVVDKHEFIRSYKFNLAFENSSYPGYVSEKLLHALQADTVPIYWGDPGVARDFNPRRFVNVHDFATDAQLVEHVLRLDDDDVAYRAMLAEPWFTDGVPPPCADIEALLDRIEEILDWHGTPIARRRGPGTWTQAISDRVRIRHRYKQRTG
jgi:hypothetical protein